MSTTTTRDDPITNPYSLRWRLLLSYAGIALLAALALGGLLLFTLRSYYDQRERDYMHASAGAATRSAEQLLRDDPPADVLQGATNILAFVSLARVRLLDVDQRVLVDSGPIADIQTVSLEYRKAQDMGGGDVVISGWPGASSLDVFPVYGMESGPNRPDAFGPVYGDVAVETGAYLSIQSGNFSVVEGGPGQFGQPGQPAWQRYPLMSRRGAVDQLLTGETASGSQTDAVITVPLYNHRTDEIIGYLELSEGPAFGTEIVNDVAEKAIVAGVIAVLLAAVAGWFTSRRISQPVLALAETTARMAEGDLSVRADVDRRDEFGLLARTFNTMAERVENTVVTLKRFVADAAHEINTPITALRTNLELAAVSDRPDEFRADIAHAQAELSRLEMLTRGLLTLARIEAQSDILTRTAVDVSALAQQIHARYASRADQAGVALTVNLPSTPVTTQADATLLARVLENLLDNALKFTPQDGTVTLGLDTDTHTVRLWVLDTGIGIPPADITKLFSRFSRASNAAAYPGNGLGLVISKAIVEAHGGSITVESEAGRTCFTVRLSRHNGVSV